MEQMNIASAQYVIDPYTQENSAIMATVDGVSVGVPLDPTNRHYAEIMRQVEAGELTIQDAD